MPRPFCGSKFPHLKREPCGFRSFFHPSRTLGVGEQFLELGGLKHVCNITGEAEAKTMCHMSHISVAALDTSVINLNLVRLMGLSTPSISYCDGHWHMGEPGSRCSFYRKSCPTPVTFT